MKLRKSQGYFLVGILLGLFGAVCFSTKAVLVKMAYRDTPVDAVSLLALRMLFSVPFFIVSAFAYSNRQLNVKFSGRQWVAVASVGCLGYYVSSLLDFLGLQFISAGTERLVLFIYPTLVLLISAILFKNKIKKIQWLAVSVTYIGLILAFVSEANIQSHQPSHFYLGSILIFACAITYAAYIVGSGRLIPILGAAKFNSYAMSFAAVGVLLHFFATRDQSLWNFSTTVYFYSFLMAIVSTVIPSYLIAEAIKRIGSDNVAIVSSVGPVSTLFQANLLLHEPLSAMQILGTALILTGVLIIGWKRKTETASISSSEV